MLRMPKYGAACRPKRPSTRPMSSKFILKSVEKIIRPMSILTAIHSKNLRPHPDVVCSSLLLLFFLLLLKRKCCVCRLDEDAKTRAYANSRCACAHETIAYNSNKTRASDWPISYITSCLYTQTTFSTLDTFTMPANIVAINSDIQTDTHDADIHTYVQLCRHTDSLRQAYRLTKT